MPTHHDPAQYVRSQLAPALAFVPKAFSSALLILDLLKSRPATLESNQH